MESAFTIVSVEKTNTQTFEDVQPHCADYLSAAHIERLYLAACAATEPPIEVTRGPRADGHERVGLSFFVETDTVGAREVPSGFVDAMVASCVAETRARIGAQTSINLMSVDRENDAKLSMDSYCILFSAPYMLANGAEATVTGVGATPLEVAG